MLGTKEKCYGSQTQSLRLGLDSRQNGVCEQVAAVSPVCINYAVVGTQELLGAHLVVSNMAPGVVSTAKAAASHGRCGLRDDKIQNTHLASGIAGRRVIYACTADDRDSSMSPAAFLFAESSYNTLLAVNHL